MQNIGIVIEAISNLKILGTLVEDAESHGIRTVLFIPDFRKGKPYDTITPELLRKIFPTVKTDMIRIYKPGLLAESVVSAGVNRLLLLNPYRNFLKDIIPLTKKGVQVHALDYFVNSIYVAASTDNPEDIKTSLSSLKSRIVASDFWRDLEFAVRPAHKTYAHNFTSLGTPLIDVFPRIDSGDALKRLGLDPAKPVISVFTPNIRDHQAYFFYGLGTVFSLRRLAGLMRKYCDRRGYQLVVKSREKQWDAKPFIAAADKLILDLPGQIHPSTSALLLSGSTLALHFGSMMVLEAAATYVPSVAISPESVNKLHGYMRPEVRSLLKKAILKPTEKSLFSFEKVTQTVSIWPKKREFDSLLDDMIQSQVQEKSNFQAFNQMYSGWQEGSSSTERILRYVQGK